MKRRSAVPVYIITTLLSWKQTRNLITANGHHVHIYLDWDSQSLYTAAILFEHPLKSNIYLSSHLIPYVWIVVSTPHFKRYPSAAATTNTRTGYRNKMKSISTLPHGGREQTTWEMRKISQNVQQFQNYGILLLHLESPWKMHSNKYKHAWYRGSNSQNRRWNWNVLWKQKAFCMMTPNDCMLSVRYMYPSNTTFK